MGRHDEGEGLSQRELDQMMDLARMTAEELHPDLVPWVEPEGAFGPMLRHPLVYQVPLHNPGLANRAYERKLELIAEAAEEEDWHTLVFLYERPYRLKAFIDHCVGRYDDEEGEPMPLALDSRYWELAADVWVDSENIEQNEDEWRALFLNGMPPLWLGDEDERDEFDALDDPIRAYRGGIVGDWSWTTSYDIAQFFARRSGDDYRVRTALIPKADCFGYLTRRGESELLVRLTPEREPLVYPNRFPETGVS